MLGEYEQFYRTWCYSGRSVSGADGWKVRAKSEGLVLPEAEGMGDLASYWSPTEFSREKPPGRRLALFRRQTDSVLVHGVPVSGLVGGRGGVSFEHVLVGLPRAVSALEALRLWRSPAWCVEDGSFGAKLGRFLCEEALLGAEFQPAPAKTDAEIGDADGTLALELLNQADVMPWASYVLQACLAAADGTVEKVFLAGRDDTLARLLFVAFYCLPERLRSKLTFSTHENPKATKGVQIVGVTTFEGEESDLPRYCYEGRYCALNTFRENKTEGLCSSLFAKSAVEWISCGQFGLLAQVRTNFDALDPEDAPGTPELDLLAEYSPLGEESSTGGDGALTLCGSTAIGHAKLRDRKELGVLLATAQADSGFGDRLVAQLSHWLPKHETASQELPKAMAEVGFERLLKGADFGEVAWVGGFAGRLAQDFEMRYWERLLAKCRGQFCGNGSEKGGIPALETRLNLLRVWGTWHLLGEDGGRGAFTEIVKKWLQVLPEELGNVLNFGLSEELNRETVRLWLQTGISEYFRRVIAEAKMNGDLRKQLVAQLAALAKEQSNALRRFPQELAGMALSNLRARQTFPEVEWLGRLAAEVDQGIEVRFWEELLVVCAAAARPGLVNDMLPPLGTRISLFEKWEGVTQGKETEPLMSTAEQWLRVTTKEIAEVLASKLSVELKVTALRLCLTRWTLVDSQEGENIFRLVCRDADLRRVVFFEMPGWQSGATAKSVPKECLRILLMCQDEQMRLADLLDKQTLDAVRFWHEHAPKATPSRMQARLSFGEYAENPNAFQQVTSLAPELTKPQFWAQEREKDAAVNGVMDRLLSRGDFSDFERALEWFGDSKWARSAAELVQLAHVRLVGVPVLCRDASLTRLLAVFSPILKEWKEAQSGKVTARSADTALDALKDEDYELLLRIAMRHLPGSCLLKSPTGQRVIEMLHAKGQVVGALQQGWIENLNALLEVCRAREFQPQMIETLARSYVALDKEADADMRAEVNALLLKFVSKEPKALKVALVAFVNNVYANNEQLFLRSFMPVLVQELVRLERCSENGAVAEVFVSFCLEGCFLERGGGNFGDRRSKEMEDWLDRFKRGLTPKSIKCLNRRARRWDEETRRGWYKNIGYTEKWIRTPAGKKALKLTVGAVMVGILAVLGVGSWLMYREWSFHKQEPLANKRKLSAWLEQYETAKPGSEKQQEAASAIQGMTNAVGFLLQMAGKKDSAITRNVSKFIPITSGKEWQRRAVIGFTVLGNAGEPAVTALGTMLGDKEPLVQGCAADCLGEVGPIAVAVLTQHLTNSEPSVLVKVTNALEKISRSAQRKGEGK